jgi:predicted nucleic acid-binding protein
MRFVLDASASLCWCFRDEQSSLADHGFALLLGGAEAIVPALWWFEIRNGVTLGLRKKRIDENEVAAFFGRLSEMLIFIAPLPATSDVFALAQRHNLTFYDAAYLELARRENVALATLDQALARAAVAEQVPLIGS